jgi:molecular chaperone GrpE
MSEQPDAGTVGPSAGVEEARASGEELLELLRRERASFLNYKRRVEQERAEDRERARGEVLHRLLPLLDELDRALAQRPDELESDPWAEGVALIHRRLLETLRQLGVERVGREGELFDPALHEAVLYEERPDSGERLVKAVLRPGYRLGDRLLRPAQVIVAGPAEATPGPEAERQGTRRTDRRNQTHEQQPHE